MLLIAGAVMGLALLLSTLLLPDLSATSTTESIRTASGLLVSAVSVVSVKEVLDRWSSLATFEVVLTGLRSCHSLPQVQLDAYWAFAQELTKKV
jgi:hypothetical protein